MWSTISPGLTRSSWFSLCLETSVIFTFGSRTLFKVSVIGVALPVLCLDWAVSQSDLVVRLAIPLPMVDIESKAWLEANLESIAVQIVITSCLARLMAHPILFSSSNYCSSIIYAFSFLLCVVVRELSVNTVVCWKFVKTWTFSWVLKMSASISIIAAMTKLFSLTVEEVTSSNSTIGTGC